ncbi:unnamed protein product, partial [Rotaria magnacalcarata]
MWNFRLMYVFDF